MMNRDKRMMLGWMVGWPWLEGCTGVQGAANGAVPWRRCKGVGVVLVCDAVAGVELKGVEIFDDRTSLIYAKSTLSKRTREIMALGGARVPLSVRVVWRRTDVPIAGLDIYGKYNSFTYAGNLIGDYTLPVAQRIPDGVLQEIRARGGALRLKFRLKTDGVLFGWDIERYVGRSFEPLMPGGDFLEMKY